MTTATFNKKALVVFFAFCGMLAWATEPAIPQSSWEHWIGDTLQGVEAPRPDGQPRMAALPVWVDCHLSWWVDRPRKSDVPLKIPSEIILRANPKICDGQLEQWAL